MSITKGTPLWTGGHYVTYTDEDHTKRMKERAAKFLAAKAKTGDHGFTGKARVAWRKQRAAIVAGLRLVKRTGKCNKRLANAASASRCPRDVEWQEGISRTHGTKSGSEWVANATDLLYSATRKWSDEYVPARKKRS